MVLTFMTGGQIVYGLGFLEKYPDYQYLDSSDNWVEIDRQLICDKSIPEDKWRINYKNDTSYHNWVDPAKLDLTCTDDKTIGLIGSVYFLGFGISAAFLPLLSDKIGRKWPYIICLVV